MLLRNMATNATADTCTPIFHGGWITKLFMRYIRQTPTMFYKVVTVTKADLALCRSLNLIINCNNGLMRFKDAHGRAWNPNDPNEILAIEDVPNHPRPGSFPGSSSQGGGGIFLSSIIYIISCWKPSKYQRTPTAWVKAQVPGSEARSVTSSPCKTTSPTSGITWCFARRRRKRRRDTTWIQTRWCY
ncbi:hypothetical protein Hanom_Chr08g00750741 [Helianthus anomalus]